jgi:hypothetical protein
MLHTRGEKQSSPCQPCLSRSSWGSQPPLTLCHLLLPGGCWQGSVQQHAMEIALASEGGSMGTWQNGLSPTSGQDRYPVPTLCSDSSVLRARLCDGNFYLHLERGALGIGTGTPEVTLPIQSKAGHLKANVALDPSGCFCLASPQPSPWQGAQPIGLECHARWPVPFPETWTAGCEMLCPSNGGRR